MHEINVQSEFLANQIEKLHRYVVRDWILKFLKKNEIFLNPLWRYYCAFLFSKINFFWLTTHHHEHFYDIIEIIKTWIWILYSMEKNKVIAWRYWKRCHLLNCKREFKCIWISIGKKLWTWLLDAVKFLKPFSSFINISVSDVCE